jgi:hypothetical protein
MVLQEPLQTMVSVCAGVVVLPFHLGNSIMIGGQKGIIDLRDTTTIRLFTEGSSDLTSNMLQSIATPAYTVSNAGSLGYTAAMLQAAIATGNTVLAAATDANLTDAFNVTRPNVKPAAGSPALSGAAWTGVYGDAFFDKVSFVGAMDASNDWTSGWAAWGK